MTRIVVVYFDAGGGHRSAALSMQQAIERAGLPWQVELLNLQEALDPIDIIRRLTRIRIQDAYNRMLQNGWTLGSPQLMRALQGLIFLFHKPSVRLLQREWKRLQPDLLVSVVPQFNRALYQSFAKTMPGKPFVTVLTDIADTPPHFWIERQPQYFVCGSDKAEEQAATIGVSKECVFRTSGMILSPRFYDYAKVDRKAERRKLGLDSERLTGLVLFGGQGARRKMLQIDRILGRSGLPIQLILICGRNETLAKALGRQSSPLPRWIEGFTSEVPYYMQLADFFIGKPGPGSLAEALHMGLPVIVERNASTLPQERYNTVWVREQNVGVVLHSFSRIAEAVAELIEPATFEQLRENVRRTQNRSLFEIPPIFQRILEAGTQPMNGSPEIAAANNRRFDE